MKKTPFISLVLISSALASCHTAWPYYGEQFNPAGSHTDTVPKHWYGAIPSDSCDLSHSDTTYYYRNQITNFQVPSSFYVGSYSPHIVRGGFGHHSEHMSFSS